MALTVPLLLFALSALLIALICLSNAVVLLLLGLTVLLIFALLSLIDSPSSPSSEQKKTEVNAHAKPSRVRNDSTGTNKGRSVSGVADVSSSSLRSFDTCGMRISLGENNQEHDFLPYKIMSEAISQHLDNVADACFELLLKRARYFDALSILHFCRSNGYEKIEEIFSRLIDVNFVPISLTDEFKKLPFHDLISILQRNTLNVDSETQVFESIDRWIGQDTERRQYGTSLLKIIRFPLLSDSFIQDIVEKTVWVKDLPRYSNIIRESKMNRGSTFVMERKCEKAPRYFLVMETLSLYDTESPWGSKAKDCKISIFNPIDKTWTHGTTERMPGTEMTYAVIGHKIFFGGFMKPAYLYDTQDNSWRTMPCYELQLEAIVALNGKIYCAGGQTNRGEDLSSVIVINPNDDSPKWSYVASMEWPRLEAAYCVHDGLFYVIGGTAGGKEYSHGEVYNPQTNRWNPIGAMNGPRSYGAAASFNGKIFVAGGQRSRRAIASVESFDPISGRWTTRGNLLCERFFPKLLVSHGRLFVFGGDRKTDGWFEEDNYIHQVEEYNEEKDEWEERNDMWIKGKDSFVFSLPFPASIPISPSH